LLLPSQDTAHISEEMRSSCQIFIASRTPQQFPAPNLHILKRTLYFVLLLIEHLKILLESLFSLLALGVVLLKILTEIDQMDLNFKIAFTDVVFFRLEVIFMSKSIEGYFLNSSF
jgi:hypothetical protein